MRFYSSTCLALIKVYVKCKPNAFPKQFQMRKAQGGKWLFYGL